MGKVKLTPAQARFLATVRDGRVSYYGFMPGYAPRFIALGGGVRVRSDTGDRLVNAGLIEVVGTIRGWKRSVQLTPAGRDVLATLEIS
jgi:hypothetical protein